MSRGPKPNVKRLEEVGTLYLTLGTLHEVGDFLGLTRERVRQLLAKGRSLGLHDILPRENRSLRAAERHLAAAKDHAGRRWERDPVRRLYELAEHLGYVPNTTTLIWGPGRSKQRVSGPYRAIYAALRQCGVSVTEILDEVATITGLPLEKRPHDWASRPLCPHPKHERYRSGACRICAAMSRQRCGRSLGPAERAALERAKEYSA